MRGGGLSCSSPAGLTGRPASDRAASRPAGRPATAALRCRVLPAHAGKEEPRGVGMQTKPEGEGGGGLSFAVAGRTLVDSISPAGASLESKAWSLQLRGVTA